MAFTRNQYDTSYGNDFSQRSFKPPGGPPPVQHNQAPALVSYPWPPAGGYQNPSSGQEGYEESDYNYGYGDDYNKGKTSQHFSEGNFNQDYNKSSYDQDFNNKGNYGQDFNKGNFGQDFNKGKFGQDFNKGNFGQNKGNFGQDFNKGNFGQDFNKGNFGQDFNKGNFGQDFNKGNFGQDFNRKQEYNEGNYKQDYNEGNYKQDYNEGNYTQDYNEGNTEQGYDDSYNQDYNEGNYNQDYSTGFKYGNAGGDFGSEWRGAETGSGMQWQAGGRGRGVGTGNVSARGFPNTVRGGVARGGAARGGASFYRGGLAQSTSSGNERMTNYSTSQAPFISNRGTGFSRGNSGPVRGGRTEGTRGRGGGFARGGAKEAPVQQSAAVSMSVSLPSSAPVLNTNSQTTEDNSEIGESTFLHILITTYQTFTQGFADCGNPISNMECSLKASKMTHLQLAYECNFLTKLTNYSIFTGVLHFKKVNTEESVFVARGYGMNKKSCKMDCYQKAYKLLMESDVETIMSQTDCGETVLRQELRLQFTQDPDTFVEYLKTGNAFDEPGQPQIKAPAAKRKSFNSRPGWFDAKRTRMSDFSGGMIDSKHLSLAPTKKVDMLMNPSDDLIDKLYTLKQLLREEGITRLHIVPKIDQLAHKAAIHIMNVIRFDDIPLPGLEDRMPVYCEIYFDDVFMTRGTAEFKRITAMQKAYGNLGNLLCMRNLEQLADNPGIWQPYMEMDLDVCSIVTKLQGRDNDSILTSNLTNMKQMMQSLPDVTIPINKMVLTEHESDKDIENVFKSLELSATRNLMLLECEIIRNDDFTFTCTLSLQGRVLATKTHSTKNGAKRLSSEYIMEKMKRTHDVIFVKTEMVGKVITQDELLVAAAKKKALGEPPGKIFKKITEHKDESTGLLTPEERRRLEADKKKFEEKENLPENIRARPLLPWMAAAMYDVLDEFYKKMTLEDLMLDIRDMPKSQRDIASSCAAKMGLRMVTKTKTSYDGPVLRRTVTAQDMSKILQLHGGQSGRYKLISCKKHLTTEELDQFRKQCLEQHKKLVEARTNDDPDADPEPAPEKNNQFSPGNIYDKSSQRPRNSSRGFSKAPYRGPRSMSNSDEMYFAGPPMRPERRYISSSPRPLMGPPRFRPEPGYFPPSRRMYDY